MEISKPRAFLSEVGIFLERALGPNANFGLPEAIAVAVGPGGFSGSRLGVGIAKSLGFSMGLGVLVYDHYEMVANSYLEWMHAETRGVAVIGDARRGQGHLMIKEGDPKDNLSYGQFSKTLDYHDMSDLLMDADLSSVIFSDPVTALNLGDLIDRSDMQVASEVFSYVNSKSLGRYIGRLSAQGGEVEASSVVVRYSRDYDAKVNFETILPS